MVTAAQFVVDSDKTAYKVPDPGTPLSPQKIPPNRKLYAECLEMFLKFQPKNPLAPTMDFTAASIYYDYGHFDKAIKSYNSYVRRYPTGEFAKPAAARVLLYHQRQFDDEGLEKAKANFLAVPAFRADAEMMATIKAMNSIDKKGNKDSDIANKKSKKSKKAKTPEEDPESESEEEVVSEDEQSEEAIETSSPDQEEEEE
jgi:tetratricopeptide (TPR) repeat protein